VCVLFAIHRAVQVKIIKFTVGIKSDNILTDKDLYNINTRQKKNIQGNCAYTMSDIYHMWYLILHVNIQTEPNDWT
jgi:hypothetical protein